MLTFSCIPVVLDGEFGCTSSQGREEMLSSQSDIVYGAYNAQINGQLKYHIVTNKQ